MPSPLAGKAAIVTGAGAGIGRAIAACLAARGAAVAVADVDAEAAALVTRAIRGSGFTAQAFTADVTSEADVETLFSNAVQAFGGVDILVNNAGGYSGDVFPDTPLARSMHVVDLNLLSVLRATHAAFAWMSEHGGGVIVNIASSAGLGYAEHPGPEYAAAKAAVIRFTAALSPLVTRGVRVNCVCPHTVRTAAVQRRIDTLTAEGRELPIDLRGALLEPDAVADAVLALVLDDAVAGRVVVLRGGEPPRNDLGWDVNP